MFEILLTLESHYPDRIRKAFLINCIIFNIVITFLFFEITDFTFNKNFICEAQAALPILFNIAKPFMSKTTVETISIYGTDKNEWTRALLSEIDSDQLPDYYGGTLTDSNGDPKCPHLVGHRSSSTTNHSK